jgi:hypothetical protein
MICNQPGLPSPIGDKELAGAPTFISPGTLPCIALMRWDKGKGLQRALHGV